MWKNYLTIALRHLRRDPLYAAITIGGLGVGLGAVTLILLYIQHELGFERVFPDAERIYKVELTVNLPAGGQVQSATMSVFHKQILDEIGPPVEAASLLGPLDTIVRRGDATAFFETVSYVNPEFLDIFKLEFLAGSASGALDQPNALVLSESMARKYFGRLDVVGEVLTLDNAEEMRITGVFRDLQARTHLDFDILARYDQKKLSGWPLLAGHWGAQQFRTYMKLAPGTDPSEIAPRVADLETKYYPAVSFGGRDYSAGEAYDARFVPLLDVHFESAEAQGDRTVVYGLAGVAGIILLIAVINYVNLATARSTEHARSVSVRRVFGARRRDILRQFLSESVLAALVALGLGFVLAEITLPIVNGILDAELSLSGASGGHIVLLVVLTVLAGLFAGLYPALVVANFRPAFILHTSRSEAPGTVRARVFLVIVQFAASIALIIGTTVVYRQLAFARSVDLGYEVDGQILLHGLDREDIRERIDILREQMTAIPGVVAAAASLNAPGEGVVNSDGALVRTDRGEVEIQVRGLAADPEFFDVYGIRPLAGRLLDRNRPLDDVARVRAAGGGSLSAFLLGEEGIRQLGFDSPEQALGRRMTLRNVDGILVGVLPDVNFYSAHTPVEPLAVYFESGFAQVMSLRIATSDIEGVLGAIDGVWSTLFPDVPIQRQFLEDQLGTLYQAEKRQGRLLLASATLAVVLACLGLYGLAAFAAQKRRLEIGVRKVFGARIRDILRLMLWQFTRPVLMANLLAWPVAYFVMRRWLEGFAYRIDLTFWPFLLAAAGALTIALATVAGHALRVARTHPALALREE